VARAEERRKRESGHGHHDQRRDGEEDEAHAIADEQARVLDDRRDQGTAIIAWTFRYVAVAQLVAVKWKNTSARSGRWRRRRGSLRRRAGTVEERGHDPDLVEFEDDPLGRDRGRRAARPRPQPSEAGAPCAA